MNVLYKAKKSLFDIVLLCGVFVCAIGIALLVYAKGETIYVLLGVALTIGGVLLLLLQIAMQRAYTVEITEEYCIIRNGILAKSTKQISIKNIVSVSCSQSAAGRILNFGDLTFDVAGTNKTLLPHMNNPLKLQEALEDAMKKSKL